jgi:hypothetical protein
MKASNLYRSFLLGVLTISMLGIQACANKSDQGAPVHAGRGLQAGASPLGQYQYYLVSMSNVNAQAVTGFLAAATDLSKIGTIQSVQVSGHIRLSGQQIIADSNSGIWLRVSDSYSATGQYAPFDILMSVSSGVIQGNQVSINFADSYGVLVVSGTISGSTMTGTLSYQNYTGANNGLPQSGQIGSFSTSTNNFFAN